MFESPQNSSDRNHFNNDFKSDDYKKPKFKQNFKKNDRPSQFNKTFSKNSKPLSKLVKNVSRLKTEKGRLESSMFLIEGTSHILDVIAISPNILNEIFVSKQYEIDSPEETRQFKKSGIQTTCISPEELKVLSSLQTPPGVIAKAYFSNLKINWNTAQTITILDSIQDPGNVGAIFRTALAMKHDAILLGKGTCEPYNPKVVRSSVGQFLHMPFETNLSLNSKISFLRTKGFSILSTSSNSLNTLQNINVKKKIALIIGNEGSGVNEELSLAADYEISIPVYNNVKSLNAAVCHGILSHELNQIRNEYR